MSCRRVIFVDHSRYIGGAQQSLLILLEHLERSRINPLLICPEGELSVKAAESGIPVRTLRFEDLYKTFNPKTLLGMFLNILVVRQQISMLANEFKADTFYANGAKSAFFIPRHRETVLHLRDLRIFKPACFYIRKNIHTFIATSDAIRDWARDNLDAESVVIANPLSDAYYKIDRRPKLRKDEAPQLLMVANLYPWKMHERAFEVAARLRQKYPGLRLTVAASAHINERDCRYAVAIQKKVEALNHDFPELIEIVHVKNDCMPKLYLSSSVLIHPVDNEPFGRCIIEAMACGLPVVAINRAGPAGILRDGGGILIDNYHSKDFAKAVDDILSCRKSELSALPDLLEKYRPQLHAQAVEHILLGI